MAEKRTIEIFSAGCSVCRSAIDEIRERACESCEIAVLDMTRPDVQRRATELGILSLPAVVVDGKLADCCAGRGVDMQYSFARAL